MFGGFWIGCAYATVQCPRVWRDPKSGGEAWVLVDSWFFTSPLEGSLARDFTTHSSQLNGYSTFCDARTRYQPDTFGIVYTLNPIFRFECGCPIIFL